MLRKVDASKLVYYRSLLEFPNRRSTISGVLMIQAIVFWSPYWGPYFEKVPYKSQTASDMWSHELCSTLLKGVF